MLSLIGSREKSQRRDYRFKAFREMEILEDISVSSACSTALFTSLIAVSEGKYFIIGHMRVLFSGATFSRRETEAAKAHCLDSIADEWWSAR
jgi:hypothetical protein